jgi:hypothetical protein
VYDLDGARLLWVAGSIGGDDRAVVALNREPSGGGAVHAVLVRTDRPRAQVMPIEVTEVTWHRRGVVGHYVVRFQVPGEPGSLIGEYQIDGSPYFRVLREELPLTGGSAEEAGLGSLRMVRYRDGESVVRELHGEGAEAFRVEGVEGNAGLADELPGGFTVTDERTGIRRYYNAYGRLAFRDAPPHLPGEESESGWETARGDGSLESDAES